MEVQGTLMSMQMVTSMKLGDSVFSGTRVPWNSPEYFYVIPWNFVSQPETQKESTYTGRYESAAV